MVKNVVIIGGGWVGVALAHKLLKHTYPSMPGAFKITLVSASTHLYLNPAVVRGVIPGRFQDDELFQPIRPNFEHYPDGSFNFVEGTAQSLDDDKHHLTLSTPAGTETIKYDLGVIATGSHVVNLPFKQHGSYQHSREVLHAMQKRVEQAKDIVIGGAGATGVELAAELGDAYKDQGKKVTIVSAGEHLLPSLSSTVAARAKQELDKFGIVHVIDGTKVESTTPRGNQTLVKLSNGSSLTTDLYIPTVGIKFNGAWLPTQFLNSAGQVAVDDFLRVKGASDLWAAGDVSDSGVNQIKTAEAHAIYLAATLQAALMDQQAKPYQDNKMVTVAVALGPNKGIGQLGWFTIPSIVVWYVKGRYLCSNAFKPYIEGKAFVISGKM